MKKEDMRVIVTKRLLTEALIKLLEEKNLSDITIKELTEKAGINRGSFYQHYKTIEELVDGINQHLVTEMFNIIDANEESDTNYQKSAFDKVFAYINQEQNVFRVMIKRLGLTGFDGSLKNKLKSYIIPRFKKILNPNLNETQIEMLFTFVYGGCLKMLDEWLNDNPMISFEQFKRCCSVLTEQLIKEYKVTPAN